MEKIERWNKNSLKWKMIPYILVMCIIAYLGLAAIGFSANAVQDWLISNYGEAVEEIWHDEVLYDENGEPRMSIRTEEAYQWQKSIFKVLYLCTDYGQIVLGILWILVSLSIPGWLFYKRYLKKPLTILMDAAENIKNQNLDFHIVYKGKDEMSRVCSAFEQMRMSLQENNLEMWRQMEERRRLNAAFAHDLRTPLTVLQGQSEMLIKYIPDGRMPEEKVLSTVETMRKHILRLEDYVTAMNDVQRLEDIEITKRTVPLIEVIRQLQDSGSIICHDRMFRLQTDERMKDAIEAGAEDYIEADMAIVMQVYENLLSNAVRYAAEKVTVTLTVHPFSIKVQDDGEGFSEQDLAEATKPFYKAAGEPDSSHFGMGLNICKILCEKHGGYLKIYNEANGASVLAVFE